MRCTGCSMASAGRNTEALQYRAYPGPPVREGRESHQVRDGRWWLVPAWAREIPKYALLNARSEDAETKLKTRGWRQGSLGYSYAGLEPFSFAGLWAYNPAPELTSCTILTAAAEPMQQLHDRQPIILHLSVYDAWLDPATSVADAKALLTHDLDGQLEFYRVSRAVNAARGSGDHAGMINPL